MRAARITTIAFVLGFVTLGVPGQVRAADPIPRALEATVRLASRIGPGENVTLPIPLSWRANLAGVSYIGADEEAEGVTVAARARETGGAWSEWYTLGIEPDEAPDAREARRASARVFTEPQWLGTADRLQVRITLDSGAEPVRDARIHLSNTLGDGKPANALTKLLRSFRRFLLSTPMRPAEAHAPKPAIISRRQWGANESLRSSGPGVARSLKAVFIHHTTNSNSYSKSQSAGLVRGIYRYHTRTRDYSDIAYNFLVDRYGQIFEGRWGGIERAVIGAHTMGFNTETSGVALIGTFTSASPPRAMLRALKKILAWKMDVHHIPPKGRVTLVSRGNPKYDKGDRVRFNRISGHRDGTYTSCPGYQTYRRLPRIRDWVAARGNPKIYLPSISSTTLRRDGNGVNESVTVRATFSKTVTWTLSFYDGGGTLRRRVRSKGTSLSWAWNGRKSTGGLVPTGRYTWRIDAEDSTGHNARAASGALYVINAHPYGTLLTDASGKYVVIGGRDRTLSTVTYRSNYGSLRAVSTGPAERGWYADGGALKLREGTLLEAGEDRYIYSDGVPRQFGDGAFELLDYQDANLIAVDSSYIDSLGPPGESVSATTTVHPDGTVVRDSSGKLWVIDDETRRPITSLAMRSRYRSAEVVDATQELLPGDDMDLPEGSAYPVREGTLIAPRDSGTPWVVTGGVKRRFRSWTLFSRMGYTTSMLLSSSLADLGAIGSGPTYG